MPYPPMVAVALTGGSWEAVSSRRWECSRQCWLTLSRNLASGVLALICGGGGLGWEDRGVLTWGIMWIPFGTFWNRLQRGKVGKALYNHPSQLGSEKVSCCCCRCRGWSVCARLCGRCPPWYFFSFYIYFVWVSGWGCTYHSTCRITCRSWFSFFTMWLLEIRLESSSLVASIV